MIRTLLAAAACLLAPPALAHDHAAAYTYADFEVSVPHIDLDACPDGLAEGDVFCRVTMNHDALHVYVFATEDDQPFVAVHTFFEDDFDLMLKR